MTGLIDQIGCERYSNGADINNNTSFVATSTMVISSQNITEVPNEKWMEINENVTLERALEDINRDIEISFSIKPQAITENTHVMTMTDDGNTSGFEYGVIMKPDNTFIIHYESSGSGASTEYSYNYVVQSGNPASITLRMRTSSTSTANNGDMHLFVDGILVQIIKYIRTSTTELDLVTFKSKLSGNVSNPLPATYLLRDVIIRNAYTSTSPDDIPDILFVADLEYDSVNINTASIVGNVTAEAALSDSDSSTYISFDTVDEEIVIDYDISVLSGPVYEFVTNNKFSTTATTQKTLLDTTVANLSSSEYDDDHFNIVETIHSNTTSSSRIYEVDDTFSSNTITTTIKNTNLPLGLDHTSIFSTGPIAGFVGKYTGFKIIDSGTGSSNRHVSALGDSSLNKSSGKWYWEGSFVSTGVGIGIASENYSDSTAPNFSNITGVIFIAANGYSYFDGSNSSSAPNYGIGTTIQFFLDLDNNKFEVAQDGGSRYTIRDDTNLTNIGSSWRPFVVTSYGQGTEVKIQFEAIDLVYEIPIYFSSLDDVLSPLTPPPLVYTLDPNTLNTSGPVAQLYNNNRGLELISAGSGGGNRHALVLGDISLNRSSGKWYWEGSFVSGGSGTSSVSLGIASENYSDSTTGNFGAMIGAIKISSNGHSYYDGSSSSSAPNYGIGTTIQFFLDLDNNKFEVSQDGGSRYTLRSGTALTNIGSTWRPMVVTSYNVGNKAEVSIEAADFNYAVPAGYSSFDGVVGQLYTLDPSTYHSSGPVAAFINNDKGLSITDPSPGGNSHAMAIVHQNLEKSSGKWYWEGKFISGTYAGLGIISEEYTPAKSTSFRGHDGSVTAVANSYSYYNGIFNSALPTYTIGATLQFFLDLDNNTFEMAQEGGNRFTVISGSTMTGIGTSWRPSVRLFGKANTSAEIELESNNLVYAIPAGYSSYDGVVGT